MIMSSFSPIEMSSIITMLPGGRDERGGAGDDGRGEQAVVRDPTGARAEDSTAAGRGAAGPVGAPDPAAGAADSPGRSRGHWASTAGTAIQSPPYGYAPAACAGSLPGALRGLRADPGAREVGRTASARGRP